MNILSALSEGNPRSLGRADEVAGDEILRMRAGDALEKVCRQQPDRLAPYINRLLSDVAAIDQPSVQWHLAQMLGEIKLNAAQYPRAVTILKRNLESGTDWIVLGYSLEAFAQMARQDPGLGTNPHKSVAKRAAKLALEF